MSVKIKVVNGSATLVALATTDVAGNAIPVSATAPFPTAGKQESFPLVVGNVPAAAVTLYGGDYILDQMASGYGTLTLQRLGPDGTTWITSLTKTASDTTTGTGITIGSSGQVRATVSGTTGCNATISRVP